jgi:hypothetical protein
MIQWQNGPGVAGPWTDISGETNSFFVAPTTVADTFYYRVLAVDGSNGCLDTASNVSYVIVYDLPAATVTSVNETCGLSNGSITFTFSNHPNMTSVQFSLNGGTTYQAPVNDNVGSVTYSGLSQGTYNVFMRWNPQGCPVSLGTINLTNIQCGLICGQVRDTDDNPLGGVTIRLHYDTNGDGNPDGGPVLTTVTGGDGGAYCFSDVPPGNYVVVQVQPNNYSSVVDYDFSTGAFDPDGDDSAQGPDNNIPVTIVPLEEDLNNDFVENLLVGSISGYVFDVLDNPMGGVTIELYADVNADGVRDTTLIATQVTNGTGQYVFTNVPPATYVIYEVQPQYYGDIDDFDRSVGVSDTDGDDSAQGPKMILRWVWGQGRELL